MRKVRGIFCFKVKSKDKEGTWIIDLKNGRGSVKYDEHGMFCLVSLLSLSLYSHVLMLIKYVKIMVSAYSIGKWINTGVLKHRTMQYAVVICLLVDDVHSVLVMVYGSQPHKVITSVSP